jgi:hypothetical protein
MIFTKSLDLRVGGALLGLHTCRAVVALPLTALVTNQRPLLIAAFTLLPRCS